jgi:hypothetical protein
MQSWDSVVNISVHAPSTGATGLRLANPNLDPALFGSRPAPEVKNLWVENGQIWQLPNLLVGFTSYSALTHFLSSAKSLGYAPGGRGYYTGPFSAKDFPLLWMQSSRAIYRTIHDSVYYEGNAIYTHFLLWPSLATLHFAHMFLSMLPHAPYKPARGHAGSAGPVVPLSAMRSFSANSPSGVRNFQAQYILYAAGGIPKSASAAGIKYDMDDYSWSAKTGVSGVSWGW